MYLWFYIHAGVNVSVVCYYTVFAYISIAPSLCLVINKDMTSHDDENTHTSTHLCRKMISKRK